jgi:hypothetical protein
MAYAKNGIFNVLYPTRRKMATILKRIVRDDISNPTGSTLVDSIRINAQIVNMERLEIEIIAMYYFIFLNNGVPQTSNAYGPNSGQIAPREFVDKFTQEMESSGITAEIYQQYFDWLSKNYPMNQWVPVIKENQKLVYTFYALDPPADFIEGYPLNV